MGNPLKYYKLLNKLSKSKKDWKNKPAPEFLFNSGYRSGADNSYWRRDNRTLVRAGESELPILGDNITKEEIKILGKYADNPFIVWKYLLYAGLAPLFPLTCSVYKGYHYSEMFDRQQIREAVLNYHLRDVGIYLIASVALLSGAFVNKMLNTALIARKLPVSSTDHLYGVEALKELEKERNGLEGKL
ncbi:MAG: hypothetical protein AABX19_04885 [Nanoarchaeota archaeon]